jgi:nitrous oxidase accessory protein NosD
MKRTALALTLISAILFSAVAATKFINSTTAQNYIEITIKADGSIDPSTAPITQTGNVYTLTGNILGSIRVEKFNIVIDGAGYTIQGNGTGRGIEIANPYNAPIKQSYDVTVKNVNVKDFEEGIDVFGYWGNIINGVVIAGNNVTNNNVGIRFSSYSFYSNNVIVGNQITANNVGIQIEMANEGGNAPGNKITENQIANNKIGMRLFWMYTGGGYPTGQNPLPMNNTIYYNDFTNNLQSAVGETIIFTPGCTNVWDNGTRGNYWSDYNGADNNGDGIGGTPYVIDANNIDHYPLISPYETLLPEPKPEPFQTALVVATVAVVVVVGAGLLLLYRKQRRGAEQA